MRIAPATGYRSFIIGLTLGLLAQPAFGEFDLKQSDETTIPIIDPVTRGRYEQHALTHQGSAAAGLKLYNDENRTKCAICHQVNGKGGAAGPDLSNISGKFDRPHLIESLLEPSRQIVEGYRTSVLVLADGRIETGIVKQQSPEDLLVFDADGKQKHVSVSDVEERSDSAVSLMPDGLWKLLSEEEFTDLIAYLETLHGPTQPKMGAGVIGAISLPEGFEIQTIVTGLTGGTALETLPDGRVFVCEQTGTLRVVKDDRLLDEPFLTVPVESYWERGLIGVTVDPDFPATPYVYVCYVAADPYPHHRVSRFVADGDVAVPGSEEILLKGDDQRTLGGKVPAGHQGGALNFGPDGKLYIGIGEQTAETPSQDLGTFQGKILRINSDGTIPRDNPFWKQAKRKYRAIWALGCRNPFTFAFDDASGAMFINDVGGKFEEINIGRPGANFGWPVVDHGLPHEPKFVGPIHTYPQSSIGGADFCDPEFGWPQEYHHRFLFADFVLGWIKTINPSDHSEVRTFIEGVRRPTDLRFSPDGSLYVLLRNAWVMDGKFQPHTGTLMRVRYIGDQH